MTNALISLLVSVSLATWLYTKQMRRSGGNSKTSLTVAAFAGVVAFIIVFTITLTIDKALS